MEKKRLMSLVCLSSLASVRLSSRVHLILLLHLLILLMSHQNGRANWISATTSSSTTCGADGQWRGRRRFVHCRQTAFRRQQSRHHDWRWAVGQRRAAAAAHRKAAAHSRLGETIDGRPEGHRRASQVDATAAAAFNEFNDHGRARRARTAEPGVGDCRRPAAARSQKQFTAIENRSNAVHPGSWFTVDRWQRRKRSPPRPAEKDHGSESTSTAQVDAF